MTDHSSGENNIESLAQRAKEVLDRVRANTDDFEETLAAADVDSEAPDQIDTELNTELDSDDPDVAEVVPVDVDLDLDVDEAADVPEADADVLDVLDEDPPAEDAEAEAVAIESETPGGYIAAIQVADAATDEPDVASASSESTSTALVPTTDFDADSLRDEDDDKDRNRRLGCLIPLLLLGLIVLAVVLLWSSIFGSDDEPLLQDGADVEVTTTSQTVDETTATSDDEASTSTETSTTSTTTTTTTTEPPAPIPDSAWQLLDGDSGTDEFAAFGATFGLQELLEGANDASNPDGFTLLAPSNEAIAALSPEQVAGFAQDPSAAEALIGYHIVDQRLTPEVLLGAAGGQLESRVGLPIDVTLDGDELVLNGQARVAIDALVAGNGNVLVIDSVLEPPTINTVIDLGQVQFEVISAIITPEGEAELQKAVAFFQDNPDANALIEGHTDTDGPAGPNQGLSERRANAVRDFLISQGVDGSRLTAEGFGETRPIIVDGVEDKVASRRIELNIR